ncbi:ankyrin repeat domain-containing protein 50 [Microdochium nivale]|nr:ankyrin repeat domain-containing protein 50 [Microdochium nivale]
MDSLMLPPSDTLVDTPELWKQNERLIRQLYQGRDGHNLTLAKVRETLIKDHQFPPLELSIFEVRLRDVARMRKKIRKEHWKPIWRHCRQIQQDGRSPEVYLNGSRMGWPHVWKEIRRNKFHLDNASADSELPQLPQGVVVKPGRRPSAPPSPTLLSPRLPAATITTFYGNTPTNAQHSRQSHDIEPTVVRQDSLQLIRLPSPADQANYGTPSVTSPTSSDAVAIFNLQPTFSSPAESDVNYPSSFEVFYDTEVLYQSTFGAASPTDLSGVDLGKWWKIMCYHNLPFLQLLESLRTTLPWPTSSPQDPESALRDNGIFSSQLFFVISLPRSYLHCLPCFFRAHDESLQSAGALSWELDPFHILVKAVYRLSNNLIILWATSPEDCLLYDILFSRIPLGVLFVFFGLNSISTRIAWTKLLLWTTSKRDFPGGAHVVHHILEHNPNPWRESNVKKEHIMVLQQLSRCHSGTRAKAVKLLETLAYGKDGCSTRCSQIWAKGLEQFADGDGPQGLGTAVQGCLSHRTWRPSFRKQILGQLVEIGVGRDTATRVFDGQLLSEEEFRRGELAYLVAIGKAAWARLTKPHEQDGRSSRDFNSLRVLQDDLNDYLERNGCPSYCAKGLVVKNEGDSSWWTVLGHCAADRSGERCHCAPANRWKHGLAVRALACMRHTKGRPAALQCLEKLIELGDTVCPWMMAEAVSGDGWLGGLLRLQALGADIGQHGQQAMVVAARLGDRRTIDWLLEQGVDINSPVPNEDHRRHPRSRPEVTIIYAAAFRSCTTSHQSDKALIDVVEYLAARGAKMARHAPDPSSITFITRLQFATTPGNNKRHVPTMMSLIDAAGPESDAVRYLLNACSQAREWDFATQLLDRGVPPSKELLAYAIARAAPRPLVQRLLQDPRIDLNANNCHSNSSIIPLHMAAAVLDLDLVQQLAARGARLDCPDKLGWNALTQACRGVARSALDAARRMAVVHYLLQQGLDVNAYGKQGVPPLGHAAHDGDLELAITLINQGADFNAFSTDITIYLRSPLDFAAENGRLDMVQLLLNIGGKSASPGSTGFEGAINLAISKEHDEIARLIQRFAGIPESIDPESESDTWRALEP